MTINCIYPFLENKYVANPPWQLRKNTLILYNSFIKIFKKYFVNMCSIRYIYQLGKQIFSQSFLAMMEDTHINIVLIFW